MNSRSPFQSRQFVSAAICEVFRRRGGDQPATQAHGAPWPLPSFVSRKRRAAPLVALSFLFLPLLLARAASPAPAGAPWRLHVIDNEGAGSDGTKLADVNGDGLPDITTAWEEHGASRIYVHPGFARVREPWPKVTVGRTPDAEDSVFADLDGDGRLDIVNSSEGKTRKVFVQWAPKEPADYLVAEKWTQGVFPATDGRTRWMFAEPVQIDGRYGLDLVLGGKADPKGGAGRSELGWLEAPAHPRDLTAWRWHPLTETGWIMSIQLEDMDGDGDADILYSDRYGATRGVYWLEYPGPAAVAAGTPWKKHPVGATAVDQIMFLSTGDLDGDGLGDLVVGVKLTRRSDDPPELGSELRLFRRLDATGDRWSESTIGFPPNTGGAKGVAIGDLDGDGRADLVASCESAIGERIGVFAFLQDGPRTTPTWRAINLAGAPGIKFDLVRLIDLDGDGDLDVLTNDERESGGGLGVIWYENPAPAHRR
jgi:hypothetical protein